MFRGGIRIASGIILSIRSFLQKKAMKIGCRPVGSVYFRDIDHDNKKAEYGIFIGEADAAGRGIGSETARLAADYARDVLKLHKLMLRVFADNVGAVKSYQNAGFVQEACLKDEFLQNGVYRDMLLMAILFEENR